MKPASRSGARSSASPLRRRVGSFGAVLFGLLIATVTLGATATVTAPMTCSRGPSGSTYNAVVTMPTTASSGSTVTLRIDSLPSGQISHVGLFYIFGMTTDYLLPVGASYVADSARIVPNTGTVNVRAGARAWRDAAGIHITLPAHVENGSSYTSPSFEFSLKIEAPTGAEVALKFSHYEVQASAFLVGTLTTTCDPVPSPFTVGTLKVQDDSPPKL